MVRVTTTKFGPLLQIISGSPGPGEKYLTHLTPGKVRRIESNFHRWARPFVAEMPDNYGLNYPKKLKSIIGNRKRELMSEIVRSRLRFGRLRRKGLRGVFSSISDRLLSSVAEEWYRRQVFSRIYKRKLWGADERSKFYSGVGSRGQVAATYVTLLSELLNQHAVELKRSIKVVDLGCGDFEVGRQLVANVGNMHYVGCDIVPQLIENHKMVYANARVEFRSLDIVADELPAGDICLIRQVLQHLSNSDIIRVLAKLSAFRKVYVTEGHPLIVEGPVNPDKRVGADVRFDWRIGVGRGVELDKKPFDARIREVFRVEIIDPPQAVITWDVDRQALPQIKSVLRV